MGKPQRERTLKENEARAVTRLMRVSPQKLNLLAQLIRGKKVDSALADLTFSRKRIAKDVKKTLQSAIANAENNHDLDVDSLVVVRGLCRQELGAEAHARRARGAAPAVSRSRSRRSPSCCAKSRSPLNGTEGQSDRAQARRQPHLGFALVRVARRICAPAPRRLEDARAYSYLAQAGRHLQGGDRAPAQEMPRDGAHRAAGHPDRQEGRRHREAPARACRA